MSRVIEAQPLSAAAFADFGDVLEATGAPDKMINAGLCGRHHDRAQLDFRPGRLGISIFDAAPRSLPHTLDMVERHPDGCQTFVPMHQNPWLVIVAPDEGGRPGTPRAFIAQPGQGVNYHRNIWHGVLCPLHAPGLFAVVDRIGKGPNLEEFFFDDPFTITQGT
ncbi:ureidoglycolate lyase [Oceaniglobus trochenteri]|uniref:ureidoglycolate lyase n=1 Tax=Oceaniglobus trochenteri TaxID=2763260 RepID=UPI001CFF6CC8|nr:ureidoglycolate lyase [Oceaniglobus trochenteri]